MNIFLGILSFLTSILIFLFSIINGKQIKENMIIKTEQIKEEIKEGSQEKRIIEPNKVGLFIFHRDLRIVDNTSLIELSKVVNTIISLFIFEDRQIVSNEYKSNPSVNFMVESLIELSGDIKDNGGYLNFIRGDNLSIIKQILIDHKISAVGFTLDYTPFAKKRDGEITTLCGELGVDVITSHDCLLLGKPVSKDNGEIYKVFTPFHTQFKGAKILTPNNLLVNLSNIVLKNNIEDIRVIMAPQEDDFKPAVRGGRINGLKQLGAVLKNQVEYNKNRNTLSYNTTHLSAYNKFGNISVREVYLIFAKLPNSGEDLVKQLFWRDFYYNIMNSDPNALSGSYNSKFDKIKWNNDDVRFEAWKLGNTGFPIVDACMRELNTTGIMHNRGRMIVADFLIKILRIDWRMGEKYFATKLIDYDPAMNNYNWQWVAGTAPFSQPYFRVFNPWTQSEKFDRDCEYIYKWIPELNKISPKDIHTWNVSHGKYKNMPYISPIIDYERARKEYLLDIKKYSDI